MSTWSELNGELDRWRNRGMTADFWWRDDDATAATPQFDELVALGNQLDVPIAIAVIPARAESALADAIGDSAGVCVLQHGYAHRNNAGEGSDKIELGGKRSRKEIADELLLGHDRLAGLFGGIALPVMVPPWNRIDADIVPLLPGLGYTGLSTFASRRVTTDDNALVTVNTHIDIIDWRGSRGFGGESRALDAAIGHLSAKREGPDCGGEPTGLLTHHLVHDRECWSFIHHFVNEISNHPAARWISAQSAFRMAA